MERDPAAQRGPRPLHVLKAGSLVAFAVLTLGLLYGPAQAKAPRGKCRSPTATVLGSGPLAVAYKRRSAEHGVVQLIACLRSTGRKQVLAPTDDSDFFDRTARAVAVDGSVVGYASERPPDTGASAGASIGIRLIYLREPVGSERATKSVFIGAQQAFMGPPPDKPYRRVESIDITNRGSVAWIDCPDTGNCFDALGQYRDARVMAGVANSTGGAAIVELSRGSTIAPRSVRIQGQRTKRVSWKQDGRRRSAPLPLPPTP